MSTQDKTIQNTSDSLLTLDEQKKAFSNTQWYEQMQKMKKRITLLEDAIGCYNDAPYIAMMEQLLIEHGLLDTAKKRATMMFVPVKRLEEQRKKTDYYKNLLAIQTKNCQQLEGTIRLLQTTKKN